MKVKKKAQTSLPALRKKAWAAWSRFVRQDEADDNGFINCITCGVHIRWEDAHCCHFVHCSKQSPLSYERSNVHAGCAQCNVWGHGGEAPIKYTLFMLAKYGQEKVDELLEMKHSSTYLKRSELEEVLKKYS